MPEGFSSVADLKVIVDANAEKYPQGGVEILWWGRSKTACFLKFFPAQISR